MGRIILVGGRARLPGNLPIPRQPVGAASEKDRVDYYYAEKDRKDKEGARNVHLVQTTPDNIPGATMSTYLSNQLNEKDMRIASLERELQSRSAPASNMMYQPSGQMNQFLQQPTSLSPLVQLVLRVLKTTLYIPIRQAAIKTRIAGSSLAHVFLVSGE